MYNTGFRIPKRTGGADDRDTHSHSIGSWCGAKHGTSDSPPLTTDGAMFGSLGTAFNTL